MIAKFHRPWCASILLPRGRLDTRWIIQRPTFIERAIMQLHLIQRRACQWIRAVNGETWGDPS